MEDLFKKGTSALISVGVYTMISEKRETRLFSSLGYFYLAYTWVYKWTSKNKYKYNRLCCNISWDHTGISSSLEPM